MLTLAAPPHIHPPFFLFLVSLPFCFLFMSLICMILIQTYIFSIFFPLPWGDNCKQGGGTGGDVQV